MRLQKYWKLWFTLEYIYILNTGHWPRVRVFANGPGDLVQSQVESYQRLKKMVLDASLLNTQHYKVRIKGKVEQSREGVAPSPTHWCSSYRKGSLRVTLDYGRQLIYIYCYVSSLNSVWYFQYIGITCSRRDDREAQSKFTIHPIYLDWLVGNDPRVIIIIIIIIKLSTILFNKNNVSERQAK